MSIGAVSGGAGIPLPNLAGPVKDPKDPGVKERVAERWKALYAGDVGIERFKAAAGDDLQVSWEEAKAAHLPGEELRGHGHERFNFYAGDDGQLSAKEGQHARDLERSLWRRETGPKTGTSETSSGSSESSMSMGAEPVRDPRDPGFLARVAERWKALYAGDVGVERFKAAAGDDGQVSWEEAKAAHLPGEELWGHGHERFNFYAGEDGQLSAKEAQHARDLERSLWQRKTGSGADTLGQKLEGMLKNGTITQGQYDKIKESVLPLPQEKIQALKGMYDHGQGDDLAKLLAQAWRRKADDETAETPEDAAAIAHGKRALEAARAYRKNQIA